MEKFVAVKEKVKQIDQLLEEYEEEQKEELLGSILAIISDEIIEGVVAWHLTV